MRSSTEPKERSTYSALMPFSADFNTGFFLKDFNVLIDRFLIALSYCPLIFLCLGI